MSTSGWSPAVSIAQEPKLIWKAETPNVVPLRRADLGREIGEGGEVVAGERGRQGELSAGQLHAVAAVPGEANHDCLRAGCAVASFSVRRWVAVATNEPPSQTQEF